MKRKRLSVEQITAVLHQAETGIPVTELCRQVGVSEQAFYRWKTVDGGPGCGAHVIATASGSY